MTPKAEKLADEHWGYVGKLIEFVYKSAFEHGFKHGIQSRFTTKEIVE